MIILTRLGGHEMAVNPDLIERAEVTPDTVITMVDGHKIVVAESLAEVIERVRQWRAVVAADAYLLSHGLAGTQDDVPEHGAEQVAEQADMPTSLARVLRLPARED